MRVNKNPEWMTEPKERLSYYTYFTGQNIIYSLVTAFLTTYLLFKGINPVKSAGVMLAVKVWDAVNDAIFGVIFDSVKFKSGKKYVPWLKISTVMIPITTLLIYVIPGSAGENVKLAWFAIAYILWDTAYTLCDVPIFGIITAVTNKLDERTSMLSLKSISSSIGAGLAYIVATVIVSEKVGGTFGMAALILSIMAFAVMLPAGFKLQERIPPAEGESFTIKRMFRYLFKNKYLLIFYLGFFFSSSFGTSTALILFVSYYLFHNSTFSLIVLAIAVVPGLFMAIALPSIIRKHDKMKVYSFCMLLNCIMCALIWTVGYKYIWLYAALEVFRAMPVAITGILMFQFTPDCAEYGRFTSGIEAKGITFAIQTFMAKLTGAVSGAMGLLLIGLFGWATINVDSFQQLESAGIVQSAGALSGLWFTYMLFPAIGTAIGFLIWKFFYKLTDKEVQVMADCNSGKITREEAEIRLQILKQG